MTNWKLSTLIAIAIITGAFVLGTLNANHKAEVKDKHAFVHSLRRQAISISLHLKNGGYHGENKCNR